MDGRAWLEVVAWWQYDFYFILSQELSSHTVSWMSWGSQLSSAMPFPPDISTWDSPKSSGVSWPWMDNSPSQRWNTSSSLLCLYPIKYFFIAINNDEMMLASVISEDKFIYRGQGSSLLQIFWLWICSTYFWVIGVSSSPSSDSYRRTSN